MQLCPHRGQGRRPHPARLPATCGLPTGHHPLRLVTSHCFSADFNWENFHNFTKPGDLYKFLGPAHRAFYKTLSARWAFNSLKSDVFLEGRSLWVQADSGSVTEREHVRGDRCVPHTDGKTDR